MRTESSTASVPVEYQSDGGGGGGGEGGDLGVGAAASVRGGDGGSGGGGGVRGKARKGRAAAVDGPPKLCVPCMLEMKYGFDPVKGPTHKHFQEQVRTLYTDTPHPAPPLNRQWRLGVQHLCIAFVVASLQMRFQRRYDTRIDNPVCIQRVV